MKRAFIAIAALMTAVAPISAVQAETPKISAKQSYCELVAVLITADGVDGVYVCTPIGGGWY